MPYMVASAGPNIENIKNENEAAPERKRTLHEELEAAAGGAPDAVGKRKVRSRKREREREGGEGVGGGEDDRNVFTDRSLPLRPFSRNPP